MARRHDYHRSVRGILSAAGYVPYRRLQREEITRFFGSGGGKGTRAVAGHDEDTTTMGVEAARLAVRSTPGAAPNTLWFTTTAPAYLDKTNATALHRALGLPAEAGAFDLGGALRSTSGALLAALAGSGTQLVVAADQRDGLPSGADEAAGGDAGAALLVGDAAGGLPLLAEYEGGASSTDEFVERWRTPGARRSKLWEDRFGETRYAALARDSWERALKDAGITAADVAGVGITGMHARAVRTVAGRLGVPEGAVTDDLTASVGQAGAAHPLLVLAAMLEHEAGRKEGSEDRCLVLMHLADGADVFVFRTTPALAAWHPARPIGAQVACGASLPYAKYLSWREMVHLEPPRRPEPQRVSSSAAWRSEEWKFGFVGSTDRTSGAVHLPPARVSMVGGAVDEMDPLPMADAVGRIVTFTIDRLAYSPSPPIVFAIVDFDRGGRFPLELTDVEADEVAIGDTVEMTFRKLYTADDIHDYFWKGRPVQDTGPQTTARESTS